MFRHGLGIDFDRLAALYRHGILDTPPDPAFDRLLQSVRRSLGIPLVQLVFVDDHRLWTKSQAGTLRGEIAKPGSMAAAAIEQPDLMMIEDIAADSRFAHALAGGDMQMRAYAAAPIRTSDNFAIGVLSAGDRRVRAFDERELALLASTAGRIVRALEESHRKRLDAASGAMTGAAFEEMVERVGVLAIRHKRDLSVLVIDIDPFRALVETFKADLGKLVIGRMSALGRSNVRSLDSFGRLSDNVFAVLLPETGATGTRSLARRLVAGLAEGWSAPAMAGMGVRPIGIGHASLRPGPNQPGDLVARALDACAISVPAPAAVRPGAGTKAA